MYHGAAAKVTHVHRVPAMLLQNEPNQLCCAKRTQGPTDQDVKQDEAKALRTPQQPKLRNEPNDCDCQQLELRNEPNHGGHGCRSCETNRTAAAPSSRTCETNPTAAACQQRKCKTNPVAAADQHSKAQNEPTGGRRDLI